MIFVVAGTSDAREIILELLLRNLNVTASITTDYGKSLINKHKNLSIINKRMEEEDFISTYITNNVKMVIDASHPFAIEVTNNVINACKKIDCTYVRYERESLTYNDFYENIIECNGYSEAVSKLVNTTGNIFLTIGSKEVEHFAKVIDVGRLFVRVLPMSEMIKKCEKLNISTGNIIAMKGPFSTELNIALMKDLQINYLVTKESGTVGGLPEKIEAAKQLEIPVLLIKRKKMEFQNVFNNIKSLLKFVKENYVF